MPNRFISPVIHFIANFETKVFNLHWIHLYRIEWENQSQWIYILLCCSIAARIGPMCKCLVCKKYESKDRKVKTIMSLKEFNLMLLCFI